MTTAKEYLKMGEKAYDDWDDEKALEYYSKAIETDPKYIDAYGHRAFFYEKKGRYEDAIKDRSKIIELEPNANNYYFRGHTYKAMGELDKATADFEKALELSKDDKGMKESAEWALSSINEMPSMDGFYLGGIDDFQKYWSRGYSCFEEGDYEGVIENYSEVIQLQPENCEAYYFRGYAYQALEQYYKAICDFEKHLEMNPYDAEVIFYKATCNKKIEKYQSAIYDYNRAIDIYEDQENIKNMRLCYCQRGECYKNLKQYEIAINDYTKAIKLGLNDDETVYFYRGLCFQKLRQFKQAIKDFGTAIELDDEFLEAYLNRACCYYDMNDTEHALKDCQYLLNNKEEFLYIDSAEEIFDRAQDLYYQLTTNDIRDNNNCKSENDGGNEFLEWQAQMTNALKGDSTQEIVDGFLRAYAINNKATIGFLNDAINDTNKGTDEAREIFAQVLHSLALFENEMIDMDKEERIEFVEQIIKEMQHSNANNIDFTQLHYNPTQGRKLDL